MALPSGAPLPPITGLVIPHEIGHAIGMPHVGVSTGSGACKRSMTPTSGANTMACGTGDTEVDANNIMGYGYKVTYFNASPWLLRAARHTHTNPNLWMVGLGNHPPQRLKSGGEDGKDHGKPRYAENKRGNHVSHYRV